MEIVVGCTATASLTSPLSGIQPEHWPAEYTSDLLDLLNVLGRLIALEPRQAALLNDILAGKLAKREDLMSAAAPPVSEES